jgi:hypothetical protein
LLSAYQGFERRVATFYDLSGIPAGVQARASNSHKLLSSNGGGGERYGKGVSKLRHVWITLSGPYCFFSSFNAYSNVISGYRSIMATDSPAP